MNDFASAAMLRILHAGMRRLGLDSPAQQWLRSAKVPLDAKRQLVGMVMVQRGAPALLQLGQGVHDVVDGSLLSLLVHPGQPLRALQAWLRLERFVHSRHRLQQTLVNAYTVDHHHVSLLVGTQPTAAEDLVVIGVLMALLERAGCGSIAAQLANGVEVWPHAQPAELMAAYQCAATSRWRLSWAIPAPSAAAASSVHRQGQVQDVASLTARALSWLQSQGAETVSVHQLAQHCYLSVRTLQRQLALEGVRFVDLLAKARTERAAQLLSKTSTSLAEIGFASGYTDQAHFSRDFKRHIGLSPQQFRQQNYFATSALRSFEPGFIA
jgi:transcriptional regulator GlxA family with amidase domain